MKLLQLCGRWVWENSIRQAARLPLIATSKTSYNGAISPGTASDIPSHFHAEQCALLVLFSHSFPVSFFHAALTSPHGSAPAHFRQSDVK
jgi:hypothetical protein